MTVAAIMLVKDEVDVIEPVLRHTLGQVDFVVAFDNRSTDGTREILGETPNVQAFDDPEVGYYQSRKMSDLAERAAIGGADWVVPVDGDEVWAARTGRLGDALDALPDDLLLAQAVLYDHVVTAEDVVADPDPVTRIGWRRALPNPLRKVAARTRRGLTFHPGNHGASYPGVEYPPVALGLLVIRHFPYRSADQFVRRIRNGAAAYAATDESVPEDAGGHKRAWGQLLEDEGDAVLGRVFRDKFFVENPTERDDLVFDPCR